MLPVSHGRARAMKIDGRLVSALIALPVALTGDAEVEEFHSLAVRDLERGQEGVGLPSNLRSALRVQLAPGAIADLGAQAISASADGILWPRDGARPLRLHSRPPRVCREIPNAWRTRHWRTRLLHQRANDSNLRLSAQGASSPRKGPCPP
jgi:hypothetical protein